jgi:hypothetical protein
MVDEGSDDEANAKDSDEKNNEDDKEEEEDDSDDDVLYQISTEEEADDGIQNKLAVSKASWNASRLADKSHQVKLRNNPRLARDNKLYRMSWR